MYQLLNILNNCKTPPTANEIEMAEGWKVLDPKAVNNWLLKLEMASNRLMDMFKHQLDQAVVSIIISLSFSIIHIGNLHIRTRLGVKRNLRGFLLNRWSCVPFEEVNWVEFCRLLEYTNMCPGLHIPHQKSMKAKIMKMGQDTIQGTKDTLAVSLSIQFNFLLYSDSKHRALTAA